MPWSLSFLRPSPRGLCMIHSDATDCIEFPLRGGTWTFPPEPECIVSHWSLCFVGFSYPQQIKTVAITVTNAHFECNNQVSSLDPQVVFSFLYTIFSSPLFFPLSSKEWILLNEFYFFSFYLNVQIKGICTTAENVRSPWSGECKFSVSVTNSFILSLLCITLKQWDV